MFELLTLTKAKLRDVIVLSQKNRQPNEDPGAKLSVEIQLTNDALAYFDGALKSFLFTKHGKGKAGQGELDGIEPVSDAPDLTHIGQEVGKLAWGQEMTGYTLVIDYGTGGRRNITILDCTLSNWRFTPKPGGSVPTCCDIESANVSTEQWGKLAKLKSREISITLTPPTEDQQQIDDDASPAPAAAPPSRKATRKTATDEFIARNTPAAH